MDTKRVRVIFRADASSSIGTGHVMRCLTLCAELDARGHEIVLVLNDHKISWLDSKIHQLGFAKFVVPTFSLDTEFITKLNPDFVVVDSYWICPAAISNLSNITRTLYFVDGGYRGVKADILLDQNISALTRPIPKVTKILTGARYLLVRQEILDLSRSQRADPKMPNILIFAGGTDLTQLTRRVLSEIDLLDADFEISIVTNDELPSTSNHPLTKFDLGSGLDAALGSADFVICAAGTSTWEMCTLQIPGIFIAVVENQLRVVSSVNEHQCGIGLDARLISQPGGIISVRKALNELLSNRFLVSRIRKVNSVIFDGRGVIRVANEIERIVSA